MNNGWVAVRRLVAVLQGIGGLLGLALVVRLLSRTGFRLLPVLVAVVLTAIFSLFLLAALLLWRDMRGGRALTILLCLLQLPQLATGPLTYRFFSPVSLAAGLRLEGGVYFASSVRPALTVTLDSSPDPRFVALNLVPLLVLLLLSHPRLRRRAAPAEATA